VLALTEKPDRARTRTTSVTFIQHSSSETFV
jgi:hypothetical protein